MHLGFYLEIRLAVGPEKDAADAEFNIQAWDGGQEVRCTSWGYRGVEGRR